MKNFAKWPALVALLAAGMVISCTHSAKSPAVSANIRQGLDQAGLKKVSVSEDRDNGVVTLSGNVRGDAEKAQAEAIAKSIAGAEVVANQIAVIPAGAESEARAIDADLDKGIEQNLDAALIQSRMRDGVRFAVKNGVVTLTGEVNSQAKRSQVQVVASRVPNVLQVVNELQVKNQKASSSE
jgi:hyperosmotically inducible periplasmic protein